jgi:AcrR family transcriptional regulator
VSASSPTAGDATRERILDVALELFTSKGYDNTSLREIAERMAFSKAALYYHFHNKGDILLALHLRLHALMRGEFTDVDTDTRPEGWPRLLDRLIDKMLDNRALFELHTRNLAALEDLHRTRHSEDHVDLDGLIRGFLADPRYPVRQRVRLACSYGAITAGPFLAAGAFGDVGTAELSSLLHHAVHDLMTPVLPDASAR